MIPTLVITILIEGAVVIGYSLWTKKPVRPILLTSIGGNLITQSFLWVVVNLFFQHYLIALILSELLIWMVESALLYYIPANRLQIAGAMLLSLGMNLTSLVAGWFLPV